MAGRIYFKKFEFYSSKLSSREVFLSNSRICNLKNTQGIFLKILWNSESSQGKLKLQVARHPVIGQTLSAATRQIILITTVI